MVAEQSGAKSQLTNVVGARDETDVEVVERQMKEGDTLLLCSDGLYGMLEDAALRQNVSQTIPVEQVAERLIVAALEKTASDNITALIVRCEPDRA